MHLIARCQRGFTTVTLMGVLSVGMLLVAGGFAAVGPDASLSRDDQDYKQAYGAAEAGLQWYLNNLAQDNDYYVKCTNVPDPSLGQDAPVNQRWSGSGSDPRVWRPLPGDESRYAVELLPVAGYSQCVEGDQYSMVDSRGNMRLRITGKSRGRTRTLLATLRRRNFLDFIYFTHFETLDPLAFSSSARRTWASTHCNQFRAERADAATNDDECTEIRFVSDDAIRGPMHTNDSILVCGSADLGRDAADSVELNEQAPGWVNTGCSGTPNIQGSLIYPSGQLGMPPSNIELKNLAAPAYRFTGRTKITLNGSTMTAVTTAGTVTQALPANGVIYVSGTLCPSSYAYDQTYSESSSCGNAWVKGEYSSDLTIAADNDVIINGNLERDEDDDGLLMGLIGNNFVRVEHRVDDCDNVSPGSHSNIVIEAAILALNHSFLVDNWYCGNGLGTLTVEGAIAQQYRGPVGTTGGTGYLKNYVYNDRLRYREPPYFLDPVQSSWRVSRQTEQLPPVK